jgi:hypothetical protein
MLAVAYIATECTGAVPPAHRIPDTPNAARLALRGCRAPTAALAGFARLTPGQSIDRTYRSSLAGPLSEYALQFEDGR